MHFDGTPLPEKAAAKVAGCIPRYLFSHLKYDATRLDERRLRAAFPCFLRICA